MRPSNTNAGFDIWSYTACQSISLNSFHSVAITIASFCLHAYSAACTIVTCFWIAASGIAGSASWRSAQICASSTLGS